ncbi:MAG: zinc-binding dehydrogenase [Candidatus Heimdallarchaeota archaeon]|nr:zinc-binding dehydrogenase [Candidatus Heimdallarchaeota archaeon]
MKAAVFTGEKNLLIEEREIPTAGQDQIVVKVAACGVCHTDEGYIEGVPTFKKPPIVLGHEASGYVHEIGLGVTKFEVGDAVLIPPVLCCGLCRFCLNGQETLCIKQEMLGNHIDGAFAEYILVHAKDVVKIPKGIPIKEAAIVSDAVATPYHAVFERAKVRPGDTVVIIGCGGVGINVIQFTSMIGAKVIAIDLQQSKLELALSLGANYIINPNESDVRKEVKNIVSHVDFVFEVVGNPITQQLGFDLLSSGGTLVLVGYSPKKWDAFFSGKVMFRELNIIGSLGCSPKSFERILHLIQQGKIQLESLITHRYKLEQINEAFNQLRSGDSLRILIEIGDE